MKDIIIIIVMLALVSFGIWAAASKLSLDYKKAQYHQEECADIVAMLQSPEHPKLMKHDPGKAYSMGAACGRCWPECRPVDYWIW